MKLGPFSRAYASASRWLIQRAQRTPSIRRALLARRKDDLARGLDEETALLLEAGRIVGEDSVAGGTPAVERRKMMEGIAILDDPPEGKVAVRETTARGATGPIAARLYEPEGLEAPSPALLFVHGGGWVTGDLDTHDTFCRRLAILGRIRVLAIEPRLAPEHRFPACADDAVAAFRHVVEHAADFGIEPTRLGIGGDSAGGNLSAVVGLDTRRDAVRPRVTALLYPAVDATWSFPSIRSNGKAYLLTERSLAWYLGHYTGGDEALRVHPRLSPYRADDVAGAPRALVAVAGFNPLVDEGVAYAERLDKAGTTVDLLRYDGLIHGFLFMNRLSPAARAATEAVAVRIGEILREDSETDP